MNGRSFRKWMLPLCVVASACRPPIDYSRPVAWLEFPPRGEDVHIEHFEYVVQRNRWSETLTVPAIISNYSVNPIYLMRCSGEMPRFELQRRNWKGRWIPAFRPLCQDSLRPVIKVDRRERYRTVVHVAAMRAGGGTPRALVSLSPGAYRILITPVFDSISGTYPDPGSKSVWRSDAVRSMPFEIRACLLCFLPWF